MKKINLSRVLVENRHKRGLTQDDLAAYMGVFKNRCIKMGNWNDIPRHHTASSAGCLLQYKYR